MTLKLEALTLEVFTPHIGGVFTITLSNGDPLQLQLGEVKSLGAGRAGSRPPFALIFHHPRLPNNAHLPQQIYRLAHPALGALEIFLVPLGPQQDAMRYEAVFT